MKIKRIAAIALASVMAILFAACGAKNESSSGAQAPTSSSQQSQSEVTAPVRVAALKGPTAMGLVKLMKDSEQNGEYEFSISGAVDEITPKLITNQVDIAAVPANLASVLFNKTEGKIKVLAINTLGVLYIVENGDSIKTAADLAGKTIYSAGKGATPEYALSFMLKNYGLEDKVTVEYRSEHAECVAMLAEHPDAVAMLPQPFATTAMMKSESMRLALNLSDLWQNSENSATLITGVVVTTSDFAEQNPKAVESFLENYKASVQYVAGNTDEAAALIGGYDIIPEAAAKKALPYCGITFVEGEAMKQDLSGYLEILFEQNPTSVGGKLPDESFYYIG